MVTESILEVCSNSNMTVDAFSMEEELTFLMLLMVAMACSTGLVTVASTSSGLAPG
jgi:hypothetical protein